MSNFSSIYFYDIESNQVVTLWDGSTNPDDLAFPTDGYVDGFSYRSANETTFYFTDNTNELRAIPVRQSIATPIVYSLDDISLQPRGVLNVPTLNDIISGGGALLSGTYQFAYRFYDSDRRRYSGWSLFCNPIPVIPADTSFNGAAANTIPMHGGFVGESTDKVIRLTVTDSETSDYDNIQFAVIKNSDGTNTPQTVAFVTELLDTAATYDYTGLLTETPTTLAEIVVEDAAINTAKTINVRDNIMFAGNITYRNNRIGFLEGTLSYAKAIRQIIGRTPDSGFGYEPYSQEQDTANYKGHFRGELYRYGITYQDEYGNWSPPEAIDFSAYNRTNQFRNTNGIPATNYDKLSVSYNTFTKAFTITTTAAIGGTDLDPDVYDLVAIAGGGNFYYYYVSAIGASSITISPVEDTPTAVLLEAALDESDGRIYKCYGDLGTNAGSGATDWKYPSRDMPYGSLFDMTDPTAIMALGLQVRITNHPTWAVAAAIVRLPREKNILFQTPIIPTMAVQGCVTPGKNGVEVPFDHNSSLDTIAPKNWLIGSSANIGWYQTDYDSQPVQQIQWYRQITGATDPRAVQGSTFIAAPPEYIFNSQGSPYLNLPYNATTARIVDAVGLEVAVATYGYANFIGAQIYKGVRGSSYFYNGLGNQYTEDIFGTPRLIRFAKFVEQAAFVSSQQPANFAVESLTPTVLGNATIQLGYNPFGGQYTYIQNFGNGSELVAEQTGSTTSINANARWKFEGLVQNQRSLLVRTDANMADVAYTFGNAYQNGADYFSQLATKPLIVSGQAKISGTVGLETVVGADGDVQTVTANSTNTSAAYLDSLGNFHLANYAAIANIEAGLTDGRYNTLTSQQFIFTGAYAVITSPTTPITFDVYGGDCFVSKLVYKLNNGALAPQRYDFVNRNNGGDITQDWTSGAMVKTGNMPVTAVDTQTPLGTQFLEVYMESEVNASYRSERDVYTGETTVLNPNPNFYSANVNYDYNFGYSAKNDGKIFSSVSEIAAINDVFEARVIWSDTQIVGSQDGGFRKFRAGAFLDLEEVFGGITRIVKNYDGELYAVQEDAVRYLPVKKDIIQTADGGNLETMTNVVLSTNIKYVTSNYGSQHIGSVIGTEFGIFFIDARRGKMLNISDSLYDIGLRAGMQKFFNEDLRTYVEQPNIYLFYDGNQKDVWYYRPDFTDTIPATLTTGETTVFKREKILTLAAAGGYFKSFIRNDNKEVEFPYGLKFGVTAEGKFHTFTDRLVSVNEHLLTAGVWGEGQRNVPFYDISAVAGQSASAPEPPTISFILNEDRVSPKTLDVLSIDAISELAGVSKNPDGTVVATAYFQPDLTFVANSTFNASNFRQGALYVNELLTTQNRRLLGKWFKIDIILNDGTPTDIITKVYSIISRYRLTNHNL